MNTVEAAAPPQPVKVAGNLRLGDLAAVLKAGLGDFLRHPIYGLFFAAIYVACGLFMLNALAEHPLVKGLGMGGLAHGQQELANQLAYLLPFAEQDKLELLQVDDPQQRLDGIQVLLDEIQGEALN